jgi:hypothetical protein
MENKDMKAETLDNKNIYPDITEEDQNIPTTVIIKDFNNNYLRTDVKF